MSEEYQIYSETTNKATKKSYWDAAKGLQQVDGLKPTKYLSELAEANIEGELSYHQIEDLLYKRYENESSEDIQNRNKEADLVSARIAHILDGPGYPLKFTSLKAINKELFKDLYDHAGQFRKVNIYKPEPVLNGEMVKYTNYTALEDTMEYDFDAEKSKSYAGLSEDKVIKRIASFTSSIWQAHPFMEGNTRTTAVFMENFYKNLLSDGGFKLRNRDLILKERFVPGKDRGIEL